MVGTCALVCIGMVIGAKGMSIRRGCKIFAARVSFFAARVLFFAARILFFAARILFFAARISSALNVSLSIARDKS